MDSIHSRSAASEVETRRYHRRRELVTAVFLNHLGFCNNNKKKKVLLYMMCSGNAGYSDESAASAGTDRVLPVSGLQVFQCPEGVSSVPH